MRGGQAIRGGEVNQPRSVRAFWMTIKSESLRPDTAGPPKSRARLSLQGSGS